METLLIEPDRGSLELHCGDGPRRPTNQPAVMSAIDPVKLRSASVTASVRIKRIYDSVEADDGSRILVDRIWPRGVSHESASLHQWIPEVAPSTELRKWFGHDPERWAGFQTRSRTELVDNTHLNRLRSVVEKGPLTLLYSARDTEHNQVVVLAAVLMEP